MRDFPSCFGENGIQVSDASSSSCPPPPPAATTTTTQNLVTCIYHSKLHNSSSFIITLTWTKTLMGQLLSIQINNKPTNQSLCNLQIKPWIFSKRKGYRTHQVGPTSIIFFWDLSSPKFGSSPEPIESFYFAITINQQLILQLGDMEKELHKKMNNIGFNSSFSPNPVFVSKKEHIFGKKSSYSTTARFCGKGRNHEVSIECKTMNTNNDDDLGLVIRIDGKTAMEVKRIRWKFRGNYTILVDGLPVEVYWDVYGWFYGRLMGNGVFMFRSCLSAEKLWGSEMSWLNSLVEKDCVESSGLGFCLVLCVWKSE
ncbi:hypothetical protein L6452_43241 [Arctium lappa]|uniref:Uncharacterized protein n=1 Tax=Arctium lappa TaxID=4217 RepID=A0ACB8XKH5_ARCLA|nr:hypothetical protein L6452_43241 [Arctium lappa]